MHEHWAGFFSAIVGSSVIGAIVGALVSLRISARQIYIENVTKERAKWRDEIRARAIEGYAAIMGSEPAEMEKVFVKMSLLLNPEDAEDIQILDCLKRTCGGGCKSTELTLRLALLLKHDWQRAQWETKPFWLQIYCRLFRQEDVPKRVAYFDSKSRSLGCGSRCPKSAGE